MEISPWELVLFTVLNQTEKKKKKCDQIWFQVIQKYF